MSVKYVQVGATTDAVSLFLPHDHRVGLQVPHVDRPALAGDVRVFAHHQPAHVREEEPAGRVVRVGVRVGELVVHAVVAHPLVDVVLERQRLEQGQQHAHRETGLVAPVRPQPVGADRYAQAAEKARHKH